MPARTFAVHLDDAATGVATLDAAVRLAGAFDARLVGVYAVPGRVVPPSVGAMFPPEALRAVVRSAAAAQAAAESAFRQAAASLSPEQVAWRAPEGDATEAMLAHGRACDLAVLAQPDPGDSHARFAADLMVACLLGLGRPILAIPSIGAERTPGQRIVVATDGGREAARAIGDAMFMLERAAEVVVLVGGRDDVAGTASAAQVGARTVEWLRDHRVAARVERYEWDAGGGGEWLLSRAADLGSDLIVMGGYGHSRLREIVLGGMTRTILGAMTVPVLLSH